MSLEWLHSQESEIIYVGDPMCSWCYGFAPEVSKVKDAFTDFGFRLILGGLRPGGTDNMADMGSFLEHHWQEVHERSGQPFNYSILGNADYILDTEPGCRAVVTARNMNPSLELDFFKAVQHAFFVDNMDMTDEETFVAVAEKSGLDAKEFRTKFNSADLISKTKTDFQLAAEMGIRGFPSMVLKHQGQFYLIANGYQKAEVIVDQINTICADQ